MKKNILIIDDDTDSLKILQAYLEKWGYTVHSCQTGVEGLAHLKGGVTDLVISDVLMPGMSGEDVLEEILVKHALTPVILLTGNGDVKSAVRTIQKGAFNYITKPIDPDELQVVVERALDHSRLLHENSTLRLQVQSLDAKQNRMIGDSKAMHKVMELVERVARTDSTVLITGETGTGKEVVAKAIHNLSDRSSRPMVACNCAALNTNLLESELFGHEKGAFTGAAGSRKGRFEEADQSTLYLDEISETDLDFQAKLLRVIQEGTFERVGSNQPLKVDVRLIASSNQYLDEAVKKGTFRQDLFYRLAVVPIHLPPLGQRDDDVLTLAHAFLDEYNQSFGTKLGGFTEAARHHLLHHPWPGNVRELRHAIERGVVLSTGTLLDIDDLKPPTQERRPTEAESETLQDHQDRTTSEYLLRVLDANEWNQVQAAKELEIDRSTLYRLLKKYQLQKPVKPENTK